MLEFQEVSFAYQGPEAGPTQWEEMLRKLSFTVEPGEFVSIIGESGCGKSTLFRLMGRLETPQEGKILLDGQDVANGPGDCAYMPQKDLLFPWRTIGANLSLPLEIRKVPRQEQTKQVDAMLAQVGLTGWKDKYPRELSGGMRQRAAFARTLLTGSSLLMLDEPFSALDSLTRIGLQEWLLQQWQQDRKTVLFITHDVEEALFLSSRILLITDRPITRLTSIPVPLPYPRTREMLRREEITALKEQLIRQLRQGGDAL
ncbi:MAG: ABC transporter ATP-binding protein [Eubacteriales bacterium]